MEFPQPQRSWLVRTTAEDRPPPLDPESMAVLREMYDGWERAKEERDKEAERQAARKLAEPTG
jgi:hypothetical protein